MLLDKIKTQEKVDLVNNLSLLVKSGKPINDSFGLLAEQTENPSLKKSLNSTKEKLEKGTSLYEAFEDDSNFGKIFVSFIRAGEESGTLDKSLDYLARWLERNNRLQKELSSATLYPKIIVSFAILLGGALSIFILPQLVPVFDTLNVDLPPTTRALLWFSDLMQSYGIFIIGGSFGFITLFFILLKWRPVKTLWDWLLLKMPVVGTISREYQLTVISQLITTLFQSGLTINDSLDIIAESVTNITYEKAIKKVRARVAKGTSLAEALKKHPALFPGVFISVVATGEETGSYGNSFQYLANFFANKVTEKTKRLPTLIEPALLIVIGIFVAFLAMAIVLPIYDVTKGLY